jgi:hypothetical protein
LNEKYQENEAEVNKGTINFEILETYSLTNYERIFKNGNKFKFTKFCEKIKFEDPSEIFGESFIDGFLFYHNSVHYCSGVTPLVGWLKPEMIAEQFQVEPHHNYLRQIKNDKRIQFEAPEKLQIKSMIH